MDPFTLFLFSAQAHQQLYFIIYSRFLSVLFFCHPRHVPAIHPLCLDYSYHYDVFGFTIDAVCSLRFLSRQCVSFFLLCILVMLVYVPFLLLNFPRRSMPNLQYMQMRMFTYPHKVPRHLSLAPEVLVQFVLRC